MAAILSKAGAADLTMRFVGLLADHRRLLVLSAVIDRFNQMLAAHRGEIRAQVTSAQALSDKRLDAIRTALSGTLGGDVAIDAQTDEDLIGGLVVRVGSRMVDASLRSKIQRMQLAMKGVG
jgi:F-type H+-transporting ATPase subunit delta